MEGGFRFEAPDEWLQGRTLYGGLSAAVCLEAALRTVPDLPPLRTAHLTFMAAASGPLVAAPSVLRQGRSVSVVEVGLAGVKGLAVRAVFMFGAARESELSYLDLPAPSCPSPDDSAEAWRVEGGPSFGQHFEFRKAGGESPVSSAATPEFLLWVRHVDAAGVDPVVALLALADAPPPAALAMFSRPAPVSTITWAVNLLARPTGGWHLISTRGEDVRDGYSSQAMAVWAEDGTPLVSAQQSVAVFL